MTGSIYFSKLETAVNNFEHVESKLTVLGGTEIRRKINPKRTGMKNERILLWKKIHLVHRTKQTRGTATLSYVYIVTYFYCATTGP